MENMKKTFRDLALQTFGRWGALYHEEADLICQCLYYGSTILSNRLTLGEEYCDIVPTEYKLTVRPPIRVHADLATRRRVAASVASRYARSHPELQSLAQEAPQLELSSHNIPRVYASRAAESTQDVVPSSSTSDGNTLQAPLTEAKDSLRRLGAGRHSGVAPILIEPTQTSKWILFLGHAVVPYLRTKLRVLQPLQEPNEDLSQERNASTMRKFSIAFKRLMIRLYNLLVIRLPRLLEEYQIPIRNVHLALFYYTGVYYTLTHRIAGVQYLLQTTPNQRPMTYRVLGFLLMVRLTIEAVYSLTEWYRRTRPPSPAAPVVTSPQNSVEDAAPGLSGTQQEEEFAHEEEKVFAAQVKAQESMLYENGVDNRPTGQCALCYDDRTHTTAAACGHLFCWWCVAKAVRVKPECPLCRAPCQPQELLRLHQFR